MKRILVALALATAVGVTAVPSVSAYTSTSQTNCGQSANLGARVCLDETTNYGPVILIYSNGTTVYASFGVQLAAPGCNPFIGYANEWAPGSNQQTTIAAAAPRCGGAVPQTFDGSAGCAPLSTHAVCVPAAADNDLLEWFVNDPTMEFVWVN